MNCQRCDNLHGMRVHFHITLRLNDNVSAWYVCSRCAMDAMALDWPEFFIRELSVGEENGLDNRGLK